MKKIHYTISRPLEPLLNQGLQIGVLAAALLMIIMVSVWNTSHLNSVLSDTTEEYVQDVTYQLTNDITGRLEADLASLQLLSDSIPRIGGEEHDSEAVQEFLDRKAGILGFDHFAVAEPEGIAESSGFPYPEAAYTEGVQEAFQGKSSVTDFTDQCLLFSAPVYYGEKIEKVLVGLRTQDNVQKLIQPDSFEGNGLSCIVDSGGQVILSPTDLDPFKQLDDIIAGSTGSSVQELICQIRNDMAELRSGVVRFTSITGKKLIMSYNSLGVGDWILLTLVPANLVTAEISGYISQTIIVIGVILIILGLFLISVLRFYRTYSRQLEQTAFSDPLTGGVNNAAFQARYRACARDMKPPACAVVLFNIKGFKLINENFGIEAGNGTIRYVYYVLESCLGEGEFMGRSESDHFFLCLRETDREAIKKRIQEMEKAVNAQSTITEIPYSLNFLQGVYVVDDPSLEITLIQDRARAACQSRRLKSETGCAFYRAELTRQMQMEQELDTLFEESLKRGDFHVYLQPKVNLEDEIMGGAEALVRWIHPVRGNISPADFIPILEKNGKICSLDLYVFEEICRLQQRYLREGRRMVPISVNLSRKHFKNLNFLQEFSEIAAEHQIRPGMVEFELTESTFLDEQQITVVKNGILKMHERGFLCSLDDFGSGYSSLGLLRAFNVDTIKLDKRFFEDMENEKSRNVIACLIDLADRLKVQTVAEGIETEEQLEYLKEFGCGMVQGYIYSRPLPIPEFEQWRQDNEAKVFSGPAEQEVELS